ncbi:MAG: LacI family DNA-binding transcriptional regulator [Blautia sp.]|jgi:LacI family sucrose operon transcriptional repressor|uniref:LacI family DNA-binding transcriptional regulator n=1 Tax=Blautia sp. OM07-19 TaxID=2292985 RepID=UPI000E518553|nr:LacI family DNA-binding transcriptional regulator [Blautia sp. OM07-19]MBN2947341.1 LacI family DNA-binding transcriptional regulator [Blautia sp.]RHV00800.1 LacI family transcriptional regulator [Blautia sp. OM07-19]RHV06528.1 LacI family transcriptional regulator [Blautia sp. OM07-19]
MGKKNITFSDIAKYTGFSKTTISRYFNNPDSLTLENQQIIADALEKLNYKENKVARILANGKTEFIGVIIPNLYMHYYSEVLNQILKTYETFGYKFLVFTGDDQETNERKYIQELLSYKIEGMIILSHTIPSRELASYNIPIVTIEREDQYVSSVNTDNYMGGVQATSLLAKIGADVLIHINAEFSSQIPSYGRIKGFTDICKEYKIPHELILTDTGHSYEETSQILKNLIEDIDIRYTGKTKGIFLPNDTFANIVLHHLIRRYGKLPDDYKLIGFDDSPVSREAIVPISTVGQQIDKIAAAAMEILNVQIKESHKRKPALSSEPVHQIIPPVLIHRETTLPVKTP